MEDQLYIRKISLCSPLLSFLMFFQDIGCVFWKKATNLLRNQSYKVGSSLAGGPAIRLRDTSWKLALKSRWLAPPFKFRSWNKAHTITKASISTSQGFFIRIFFPRKNQSKWGQVGGFQLQVAMLLPGNSSADTHHEEFAEKKWNRFCMLHVWNIYSYLLPYQKIAKCRYIFQSGASCMMHPMVNP